MDFLKKGKFTAKFAENAEIYVEINNEELCALCVLCGEIFQWTQRWHSGRNGNLPPSSPRTRRFMWRITMKNSVLSACSAVSFFSGLRDNCFLAHLIPFISVYLR